MNLSITEQLQYSTVRIECEHSDGSGSTGSGYFFKFKESEESGDYIPVVITNKHVINGAVRGRLILTTMNELGEPLDTQHFNISIDDFESYWVKHPDPDVDLCAMPIAPFLNAAESQRKSIFFIPLDKSLIPTDSQLEELSALEDVVMVGYPNGIWDVTNNKPIFRKGVTATHPFFDYNGKKEFMIDMACFPGSSGSPVFLLNEGGYRDKKGNTYLGATRIYILGTLYAGPQHTATGEVRVINIPTSQKPIAISNIPNNLGLIIKSTRIKELENLF